ncbi:hypothetical protein C8Q75DRAFT_810546 [Abortiporus biennis]|nr:hypothetical protein C8Q75DRAFT_810546 [Abortiporus biennis]
MYSSMQYTPLANYSVRSNATVSPFQFTPMATTPSYQCTQTPHHGVQCVPTYPCNASTTPAVIPGMFTPSLYAIPLLSNQSAQVRPAALNANRASPWVPHPQPHPYIPAASFWMTGMVGGAPILVPTTPLDPRTAMRLTGGWPLPGTAVGWTPVWPPSHTPAPDRISRGVCLCPWLIPNPGDPNTPHVIWDISTSPMTALRITGRNVILSLRDKFGEQATYPATDKLLIYCPLMQDYWGPIVVKSSNIVLEDVLYAIYEYFQTPLTRAEYDYLCDLNPGNQQKLHDALWQRSLTSGNLTGFDISQGLKRVDCLGDNKVFWGLWVTYNFDNTFHLNVGLQPRKRG